MAACGDSSGGGINCPETSTVCNGACVDTDEDPANCGECGNPCDDGLTCIAGECTLGCVGGTVACNGACVDTDEDPANCGECGNPCDDGLMCQGGRCALQCSGDTTACDGTCVDTQTNRGFCGACDNACDPGQECVGGYCVVDCTNRNAPGNLSRETTMLRQNPKNTKVWNDVFGSATNPVEFPNGTTITHIVRIDRDKYAQIDFNTNHLQAGQKGFFDVTSAVPTTDAKVGSVVMSISECAGDFGPALAAPCRRVLTPGRPNGISWAEDSAAGINDCPLDLEKQYFLNMVPSRTLPETQDVVWNCSGQTTGISACEFAFRFQRN